MTARPAAAALADYACALRLEDIPADALGAARTCLIDAVACAIFGAGLPWSRILREHAAATGAPGACRLPGLAGPGLEAGQAALLGGAYAHAFELDSLRKPGAGVHPGATVALPALAVAQEVGADWGALLRAIVGGVETMFRIGDATLHSAEGRGFHAPGVTGVFGAAVAAGMLRGLSPAQLTNALGVAGSFSGGLLAFAAGEGGGMVKRLHMGRAAQGGVIAVDLAARGYEGPASVLEGRFGVLEAFCPKSDPARLTDGLGARFEIRRLCLKRYACHVTAQAPVELLRDAMAAHGFTGADIASITLGVSDKVLSHHANPRPSDVAGAQYSAPWTLAIAAFRDPDDPRSFLDGALDDAAVADLASRVGLIPGAPEGEKWGVEATIVLRSGAQIRDSRRDFTGAPERPFSDAALRRKFVRLAGAGGADEAGALHDALRDMALDAPASAIG